MPSSKARKLADLFGGTGDGGSIAPNLVSDLDNTSTGFYDLPAGTTADRPSNPNFGYIRYNTTLGFTEQYTSDGWVGIAPPPTIASISPLSFNGESGTEITVNGSSFDNNAVVKFITSGGTEVSAGTTTRVSSAQLTATTPQNFTVADEPISVKVTNGSGLSAVLDNALDAGGSPTWGTASGELTSVFAGEAVSTTVSATDPEGSIVTFSKTVGDLPFTLNTSTGSIIGTAGSSNATHSFTLAASDPVGNQTERPFSIRVIDPVADSGGGEGWATAYSTDVITNTLTNNTQTVYNTPQAGTPADVANLWDWASEPAYTSAYFRAHSGHDGNQDYYAVQISSETPRVANYIDWRKHVNAVGTIKMYGSNQAITSSNFQQLALWTELGTGSMGGSGSESDGTTKTVSFNPNRYGYRWYMIRTIDFNNDGSTMQGWAMYSARLRRL
jgi:hypothetical protein